MYDITWEDYMEKNKTNLMAKFLRSVNCRYRSVYDSGKV